MINYCGCYPLHSSRCLHSYCLPSLPSPCLCDSVSIAISVTAEQGYRTRASARPLLCSLSLFVSNSTMLVPRTTVRCLSSLLNHHTATRLLLRDVPRSTSLFFSRMWIRGVWFPPVHESVLFFTLGWSNFWSWIVCITSAPGKGDVPQCLSDI